MVGVLNEKHDGGGAVLDIIEEEWKDVFDFSNYRISNLGRIYNIYRDHIMNVSCTTFGHLKVTLKCDYDGERYTRGVAQMVADAFVKRPNPLCDHIIVLDGNFSNVSAYNLAWRPRGFMWEYTRQLKIRQPLHYRNLPVVDVDTGEEYESVIEVGMSEGLLFKDVWRSTYSGVAVFPTGSIFEIVK